MSATRDKKQRVAFVYSNLYEIYKKGKPQSQNDSKKEEKKSPGLTQDVFKTQSGVLKVQSESRPSVEIKAYHPANLLQKRIENQRRREALEAIASGRVSRKTPEVAPTQKDRATPVESLKQNLEKLNDLHLRLKFMLKELEDLVKE